MRNKFTALLLTLLLLFLASAAAAETPAGTPAVQSVVMEKDGNRLAYPQLTGLADAAVQQLINDDIVLSADLTSHMITFATLTPDSLWGLQVSYEACVNERVAHWMFDARRDETARGSGFLWGDLEWGEVTSDYGFDQICFTRDSSYLLALEGNTVILLAKER